MSAPQHIGVSVGEVMARLLAGDPARGGSGVTYTYRYVSAQGLAFDVTRDAYTRALVSWRPAEQAQAPGA